MLLRDPIPGDFARFVSYAARVKMFFRDGRVSSFPRYQISSDLWAAVLHCAPKPLFPNLRTLRHIETDYGYRRERELDRGPVYLSELFWGPELRETHIDFCGWPSDKHRPTELVRTMALASPRIEVLSLRDEVSLPLDMQALCKPGLLSCPEIGRLHYLVKFSMDHVAVAPAALAGLASLPRLRELLLHVNPAEYGWDDLPHGRYGDFFPALTNLRLHTIHFEWCIAFMHAVTSPSLWRLKIDSFSGLERPWFLLEALCASVGEHPSCRTIQVFSIDTGPGCPSRRVDKVAEDELIFSRIAPADIYHPHPIAPVFSLSALRWFAIGSTWPVIADDDMLDAMTWAWPNLESLAFNWPSGAHRADRKPEDVDFPRATLSGVLSLARYCPRLIYLELAVDMRYIPDFDAWRWPPISLSPDYEPPLKSFHTEGSVFRASDTLPLAAFFSLVFPRLSPYALRSPLGSYTWLEMENLYRLFSRVRQQERGPALVSTVVERPPRETRSFNLVETGSVDSDSTVYSA